MSQKDQNQDQKVNEQEERKPNENIGFHFSSFLKITDPDTGQILVQTRAD